MQLVVQHPTYGAIVYEESAWTGKKTLWIGGVQLKREQKNAFTYVNGDQQPITVTVKGGFLAGAKLFIGDEVIEMSQPAKWYENLLAVLIVVTVLVWGNSAALCSIFPIVGGAIGGAISGGMGIVSIIAMKSTKKPVLKVLIWLGIFAATLLICFLIAAALLSAIG